MAQLKFFLFGPPRIEVGGQRIEIGLQKSVALLAYLAVTKQPHSRDTLATLLWPDAGQRTALGYLRRALYRINQALKEDVLIATRKTVEFKRQANIWLDTDVFEGLVTACLLDPHSVEMLSPECMSRLSEAVELYTDHFLAGFTLPDCPAFDEWQFFRAESLRRSLGKVLEQLAYACRSQGEWEQATTYTRRWVALDPLQERAQRCLMELYAWTDQQAAALRQYEGCRRILSEELGVLPENQTTALYEAIKSRQVPAPMAVDTSRVTPDPVAVSKSPELHLQEDMVPNGPKQRVGNGSMNEADRPGGVHMSRKIDGPGPPHNLPIHPHPLIGRKQELSEIRHLLVDDPTCRLLTVIGPGGIGKTRLALEAAYAAIRTFSDGVYFIPLTLHTLADHIASAVAEHLGLRFYEGSAAKQQLLHYLRKKRMLLVLDNFEHLLPDVRLITDILQVAPDVKILVTSSERLNLCGETVYMLGGLTFPEHESAKELLEYGAVQLLIQCARLARPHLKLQAHDFQQVARICCLVQGMPLALVLAAGWLEVLSFQEIADEIAQSLGFLEGQMRDLPERHRSVQAAFDSSWKRLSADEQQAFMKLSVFQGGFTRQAAQAVAGAGLRTLRPLVNKSFLSAGRDDRYEIHELLRQYGAERLETRGGAVAARTAHSQYYLNALGQRTADLKGRRQLGALEEIEADFENIRTAWSWALQQKDEAAIDRALESLYLFCDIRGRQQEGAEFFQSAQARLAPDPGVEPSLVYGRVLSHMGMLQSRYLRGGPGVGATIEQGLVIAQKHGDLPEIAFGLLALGHFASDTMHDVVTALQYYQQSLEHYHEVGDDYCAARALHLIGHCYAFLTGLEDFIRFAQESLSLARKIGDKANTALLLVSLSMALFYTGDYAAMDRYAQQATLVATEIGHGASLAQVNTFRGILYLLQGQLEQASKYVEAGFAMARDVSFPIPLVYAQAALGVLSSLGGRPDEGVQHAHESKAYPTDPFAATLVYWASAIAHCGVEDLKAAHQDVQTVLTLDRQHGSPSVVVLTLPAASVILAREGHPQRAVQVLALSYSHPLSITGWMEKWPLLTDLRAELETQLGSEAYQAAWERGRALDVQTVKAELLADWGGSRPSAA